MNFSKRILMPAVPTLIWSFMASAGEPGKPEASRRPTMAQMQASSMPSYKAASGAVEECLGRLVWSADKAIEWPVRYNRNQHAEFTHSFSENVFSQGNEIHFGNTLISVNALAPGVKEELLGSLPGNNVSALRKQLAWMETELQKAQARKNGDAKERNRYQSAKSDVESTKKTISAMTEKYKSYEPGIADSYGYWSTEDESSGSGDKYSIFRAYLFAPKYFYKFESSETLGPKMSMETHRKQFSALLAGDSVYVGGMFAPAKVGKHESLGDDFAVSRLRLTRGYAWSTHHKFAAGADIQAGVAEDGTVYAMMHAERRTSLLAVLPSGEPLPVVTYASSYCDTDAVLGYGTYVLALRRSCDDKRSRTVMLKIDPATGHEQVLSDAIGEPLQIATQGSLWAAVAKAKNGQLSFYSSRSGTQ